MHMAKLLASAAVVGLVAIPGTTAAQTPTEQQQQSAQQQAQSSQSAATGQQPVAEECLAALQETAMTIRQDEYWIGGWGSRWGYGTPAAADPTMAPGAAADPTMAPGAAPAPGAAAPPADPAAAPMTQAPWSDGETTGMMSPRYQVSVLYSAANVLAHRGNEDGCRSVLDELNAVYEDHVTRLRESGVEPGEITSWRQEQMALAQAVTELPRQFLSIDNLTGISVRNPQDEHLGSVDDVILSEETGAISHLVVEHGGFLGIGRNHVLVPWEAFSATPGLNVLVLNVSEDQFENAPKVDPDAFRDGSVFVALSEESGRYWEGVRQQ